MQKISQFTEYTKHTKSPIQFQQKLSLFLNINDRYFFHSHKLHKSSEPFTHMAHFDNLFSFFHVQILDE